MSELEPTSAEERGTWRRAIARPGPPADPPRGSDRPRKRDVRRLINDVECLHAQADVDRIEIQAYSELLDKLAKITGAENYVEAVELASVGRVIEHVDRLERERDALRAALNDTLPYIEHECKGDLHNKCCRCDVAYSVRAALEASDE